MTRRPRALLPAAFNTAAVAAAGVATGLMAAVPLWFLIPVLVPGLDPLWTYIGACVLAVAGSAAAIAVRLTGTARMLALVFPLGFALACAVPPVVSELVQSL
ncbi:hypothetical protein [Gordonia sihwensis]|uniref:hypothetical protein n=1 Tax=Gordonia sihwensis TaxID=173559 RepID=UPI0005EEAF93|nr:hypothetical protein [Gordonia sihwensis]KJR05311.1 hypothetical protein UG54_16840 [Gordonia sihwensis]MBY4569937.1 hypothetical protein [Gordonia sihwensis]